VTLRDRGGSLIGMPVLEQFIVTLDLANKRVGFRRPDASSTFLVPEPPTPPSSGPGTTGRPPLGFALAPRGDGSLAIVAVEPTSNAGRAGLRENDLLVELDGVSAAQMNVATFRAIAAKGTPVKLVVSRDGKNLVFSVSP
jgi:S1-C subfamily serine protease